MDQIFQRCLHTVFVEGYCKVDWIDTKTYCISTSRTFLLFQVLSSVSCSLMDGTGV